MNRAPEKVFLLLCLCTWACTGTEAGNPPFRAETNPNPGVAPGDVSASIPCPAGVGCMVGAVVDLSVEIPRDAMPEGVTSVVATALDTGERPVRFDENEAAFLGTVRTPADGEVRIRVTTDRRLAPLDLRLADEMTLVEVTRAFEGCLLFEQRDYPLTPLESASIRLRNDCAEAVTIDATGTRLGSPAFDVHLLTEPELLPGSQAVIEATATEADGPDEDVLFIEVFGSVSGRQPITLYRVR